MSEIRGSMGRQPAPSAARERADRLRSEADQLEALADEADAWDVSSKAEVALWHLLMRQR